jgi:hypothetical protein
MAYGPWYDAWQYADDAKDIRYCRLFILGPLRYYRYPDIPQGPDKKKHSPFALPVHFYIRCPRHLSIKMDSAPLTDMQLVKA